MRKSRLVFVALAAFGAAVLMAGEALGSGVGDRGRDSALPETGQPEIGQAGAVVQAEALVGGWQGWTVEPNYGSQVAYEVIIFADGRYSRSYRPMAYPGGVYDAGTWRTQGNLVRFDIRDYQVSPQRPNQTRPAGDSFVYQFQGPNTLVLTIPNCMWPNPQLCTVVLQRVN